VTEKAYAAAGVTVFYDAEVCQHAGACVRGLPQVFDVAKRPWIQPENATPGAVVTTVLSCPSGALRTELPEGADGGHRQA
jgi:uncharacterized Fe-S cluster protein YjdI